MKLVLVCGHFMLKGTQSRASRFNFTPFQSNIKLVQNQNWPRPKTGPNLKLTQTQNLSKPKTRPNLKLAQNWPGLKTDPIVKPTHFYIFCFSPGRSCENWKFRYAYRQSISSSFKQWFHWVAIKKIISLSIMLWSILKWTIFRILVNKISSNLCRFSAFN